MARGGWWEGQVLHVFDRILRFRSNSEYWGKTAAQHLIFSHLNLDWICLFVWLGCWFPLLVIRSGVYYFEIDVQCSSYKVSNMLKFWDPHNIYTTSTFPWRLYYLQAFQVISFCAVMGVFLWFTLWLEELLLSCGDRTKNNWSFSYIKYKILKYLVHWVLSSQIIPQIRHIFTVTSHY